MNDQTTEDVEPENPTLAAQFTEVVKALNTLSEKFDRDGRQRTIRIRINLALIVLVATVAGYAVWQVHEANIGREQRTVASCLGDQDRATASITAFDRHDLTEARTLAPLPRSPALQAKADQYMATQHRNAVDAFQVRDCSTRGIRDYFTTPRGPHAFLPPPPPLFPHG